MLVFLKQVAAGGCSHGTSVPFEDGFTGPHPPANSPDVCVLVAGKQGWLEILWMYFFIHCLAGVQSGGVNLTGPQKQSNLTCGES